MSKLDLVSYICYYHSHFLDYIETKCINGDMAGDAALQAILKSQYL